MAKKNLDILPVFNHRKSVALVDTAEDLVDSLDNLSVCLKHIEEKFNAENGKEENAAVDKSSGLYKKLIENLEIARDLTDTLKREKWRLSRRQMSVEIRMGELEDYKSHLKQDMTDMNQTVEVLSMRIVELENSLCDAQEIQESKDAEYKALKEQLQDSEKTIKDMNTKEAELQALIKQLRLQRTDSVIRRQHDEVADKLEVLMLENHQLKEIIRERDTVTESKQANHENAIDEHSEDDVVEKKSKTSENNPLGLKDANKESSKISFV